MQRVKSLALEAKKSTSLKNPQQQQQLRGTLAASDGSSQDYLKAAYLGSLRPLNLADFEFAILKTSKSLTSVSEFNVSQWGDDNSQWIKSAMETLGKQVDKAGAGKKDLSTTHEQSEAKDHGSNTEEAEDDDEDHEEGESWHPASDKPLALD
jgi:hypothetical protein